jgi:predicted AlkP superfamily phosphohydrolase/phosphomutase
MNAPLPISGSTWVTLLTGQSIGVHGAMDYVQIDPHSYHGTHAELTPTESYWGDTIFSILSAQGYRVASLFLPMTYPPQPVNGLVVSGVPMPDETRPVSWPPEVAAEIGHFTDRRMMTLRYEDKAEVERYLAQSIAATTRTTKRYWREGGYDFLATCLASPDIAHHYFWARDDPEAMERIYRIYDRVDQALGELIEMADDDTTVVLFSDHGGGDAPRRIFSVGRWMVEEGYLALRKAALGGASAGLANRLVKLGRRYRLNEHLRRYIRRGIRQAVLSVTHNDLFADWSRSRAYPVEFFFPTVGIEINLRGRQAQGIVEPGEAYESLRREICAKLESVLDPETGKRVFQWARPREDHFHGPHLERIPDIVAYVDLDYDPKIHIYPEVIRPNEQPWEYPYMGYHAQAGVFAVRAPGARAGQELPPGDMTDLAPTLLELAGAEIPESVEGKVLGV